MSKIKKNNPVKTTEKVVTAESILPVDEKTWLEKLTSGYLPYLIIALLSIVLYANTFKHQFALDDDIVPLIKINVPPKLLLPPVNNALCVTATGT